MAWVQIAVATLSGNSLRQTVHTHVPVHHAAKLVAALIRVAGVTAGLAKSNGSLPPGLWLTSPAGWLPRTGISSRTLRSVIEYELPLPLRWALAKPINGHLRLLHPLNGLFSWTTWVRWYQKGNTSLDLIDHDGVFGCSGISWTICKQSVPRSRQITTPTPHHSIFTGRMLFMTPNQQCQSTKGTNHWRKSSRRTRKMPGSMWGPAFLGLCWIFKIKFSRNWEMLITYQNT